jgi:hypothetical protein
MRTSSTFSATALLIAGTMLSHAAEPLRTSWNNLCHAANHHQIRVTTQADETVDGNCYSVRPNDVTIGFGRNQTRQILRQDVKSIQLFRVSRHQVRSMADNALETLYFGVSSLASPAAPAAFVVVPGTIAWAAAATPFCIVGDLISLAVGPREVIIESNP